MFVLNAKASNKHFPAKRSTFKGWNGHKARKRKAKR